MKFGPVPVERAAGCVLAHSLRLPECVLKKGRVLSADDVIVLHAAGVQRIYGSKNFKKGVPVSNASNYNTPTVDALLEGAAVENDPVKRKAMFMEFQKIVAEELPDISLYSPLYLTIKNKRVREDSPTADGVEGNMSRVWLDG